MIPLGLKKGTVKVVPHQAAWHSEFDRQKKLLLGLKNKHILAVEHTGSTSVEGMPAKPIIDLILGIDKYRNKGKLVKHLAHIGYEFRLDPRRGQPLFVKTAKGRETHYLKVVRYKGKWWNEYMEFKNRLTNHKKAFDAYKNLKIKLGKDLSENRKAYTKSKAKMITKILSV